MDVLAELTACGIVLPPTVSLTEADWKFARTFVETGQMQPALAAAGWKVAPRDLAGRAGVQAVIRELQERRTIQRSDVADRDERKRILTEIARGGSTGGMPSFTERMKAVELLGKMDGDFTEKQEIHHVSYVVPLPPTIKDATLWAEQAKLVMADQDGKAAG